MLRQLGIAAIVLALAAPVGAQERRVKSDTRLKTGLVLVLGGAAAMAGAFNYRRDCDDGYRSTFGNTRQYDYCTTVAERRHVHTEETPIDVDLARPALLYVGAGAAVLGTLLATVWVDVPATRRVVEVEVEPDRVLLAARLGF